MRVVEYKRMNSSRRVRGVVVATIAMVAGARLGGFVKFGWMPGGGGAAGIVEGLMFGGREVAMVCWC